MDNIDNVKALLHAGAAATDYRIIDDGIPFAVIPDGYKVSGLEKMLEAPIRKRATVITSDANGFIDYLNKHASQEYSLIYAQIDSEKSQCKLVAVIDDHGGDLPQWREHTCAFEPKQAVEWMRWMEKNKAPMTQTEFAGWLEDNLTDVASVPGFPSGADILAMALGFEANAEKRLRSKINLQNGGVQFEFVEDEAPDTRTSMKVFERFTLGLPVFDGSTSAYPLEARLKYREKSGALSFWYELIRPDRVFKTAVTDELANIKEGTGLSIIAGVPGL
jgi:uncharacterized protein YfdQ (DUF2303 family)